MTQATDRPELAIWGPLPPPFGGVSVHVDRLCSLLRRSGVPFRMYVRGHDHRLSEDVEPGGSSAVRFLKFLLTVEERVVHLHACNYLAMLAAPLLLGIRRKKVILTIHDDTIIHRYEASGSLFRWCCRRLLKRCHCLVAVSKRLADWLQSIGIEGKRVHVMHAFLPPTEDQLDERNIPRSLRCFIAEHTPVIGSQGWFGETRAGRDVYALELLARMIGRIRKQYPDAGLYTVVSGTQDPECREKILRLRDELGLGGCWEIVEEPFHAVAVYQCSDLFVRPTITDGDSVSVRECLALGTPVVASDAVERPKECLLFTSEDLESLLGAVKLGLRRAKAADERWPRPADEGDCRAVLALYESERIRGSALSAA